MSTTGTEGEPHGFNELRIEDKKGQEEIYAHADKDVNVYVKNDWKEHILHDQHRAIDNFSYSMIKGEDHQTVHKDRKVELLSDDHLTVRGSRHAHIHEKWLVRAGREIHGATGRKTVIEAGSELTLKAGGAFIRLDPSGVYINGEKVKLNSGGSPGKGSGARPLLPVLSTNVGEVSSFRRENVQSMGAAGSAQRQKKLFLALGLALHRYNMTFHACCLMTNHFHQLLETPDANQPAPSSCTGTPRARTTCRVVNE
jgi:type VI secretion system secreted protein VgrG